MGKWRFCQKITEFYLSSGLKKANRVPSFFFINAAISYCAAALLKEPAVAKFAGAAALDHRRTTGASQLPKATWLPAGEIEI